MANYLLDTNHAASLVTFGHPLRRRVAQHLQMDEHSFSICIPIITEVLYGIRLLPRARQNVAEWKRMQPRLTCYIPDPIDAEFAADLQVSLRLRGWQLETVDALIAAIVLRYDLILLTTDQDFTAVPDLKHENWIPS